jgi:hypothetical protein
MAPGGREEAMKAFDHIIENVFLRSDTSTLKEALIANGIKDMYAFMTIDSDTIDGLAYNKSAKEKNVQVSKGDKGLIKMFLKYVLHRSTTGDPVGNNWKEVTQVQFDDFRASPELLLQTLTISPTTATPAATAPVSSGASKYSAADMFRRGIKRDPSLFPTLKDERFNDHWHRSFEIQARAQDVYHVLDGKFKPVSQEDKELFEEKKKYMYAVL